MTLRVVGAGLGRTGTASLQIALEHLGFGPCYHMKELLMDPSRAPLWVSAAEGNPDWEQVFHGYASTVDYPGCSFWRELMGVYPEAKLLLSVRDPDQWFDSTQGTIFGDQTTAMITGTPVQRLFDQTVWKDFGGHIHDRPFMVEYFKRHNAEVQRSVPADRLLVYEVTQGWEPLCRFLAVPVPDMPFPRINTREDWSRRHASGDRTPTGGSAVPGGAPTLEEVRRMLKEQPRGGSGSSGS